MNIDAWKVVLRHSLRFSFFFFHLIYFIFQLRFFCYFMVKIIAFILKFDFKLDDLLLHMCDVKIFTKLERIKLVFLKVKFGLILFFAVFYDFLNMMGGTFSHCRSCLVLGVFFLKRVQELFGFLWKVPFAIAVDRFRL